MCFPVFEPQRFALFIQERFRRRFGHLRKKSDDLDNENVEEKRGICPETHGRSLDYYDVTIDYHLSKILWKLASLLTSQ